VIRSQAITIAGARGQRAPVRRRLSLTDQWHVRQGLYLLIV